MNPSELSRILQNREAVASVGVQKMQQILQARNLKASELAGVSPELPESPKYETYDDSLVSKMGLNPYGLVGQAVNLGANLVSGTARLAGDIAALPPDLDAVVQERRVSPQQMEAYNRLKAGKASEQDKVLLSQSDSWDGFTALERLQRADASRKTASSINKATDFSGLVYGANKAALIKDLGDGFDKPWEQAKTGWDKLKGDQKLSGAWDMAAGIGKLIVNAGEAALDNPMGTAEFIAENLPQVAIGLAGAPGKIALTASNAGYAVENYRKGILKYQADHNGAYPPEDVRAEMAQAAALSGLLEHAGEATQLMGFGKITKALTGGAEEGVEQTAKQVMKTVEATSRQKLKDALLNVGKPLKAPVLASGTEAATEGAQTYLEGVAGLEPADAKEIYTGAVIGGLSGGAVSSVGSAAGVAADLATKAQERTEAKQEKQLAVQEAVTTGVVDQLVDPKGKTFDPVAAVSALYQNASLPDATPESWDENRNKAVDISVQLSRQEDEILARLPGGKASLQKRLASLEQEISSTDPADGASLEYLSQERDTVKQLLDLPLAKGSEVKALQKQLGQIQKQSDAVYEQIDQFPKRPAAKQAEVEKTLQESLALASTKVDPADTASVKKSQEAADLVINLSMSSPQALDATVARQLADDAGNALTDKQRSYLRQFSDAQVAINQLKDKESVHKEVIYGDPAKSQLGVLTYQARMSDALQAGNRAQADRQLQGLSNFLASHVQKAKLAREGLEKAKAQGAGRNPGFKLERTLDKSWKLTEIPVGTSQAEIDKIDAQLRKNGGLRVHKGSDMNGLITGIEAEAEAIRLALSGLTTARDLKWPKVEGKPATETKKSAAAPAASPKPAVVKEAKPTKTNEPAKEASSQPKTETKAEQPETPKKAVKAPKAETKSKEPPVMEEPPVEEEQPAIGRAPESDTDVDTLAEGSQMPSEPEQKAEVETKVAERKDGWLSVLDKAEEDKDKPYRERNLVATGFTQKEQGLRDTTVRPLVAIKDFLSTWKTKPMRLLDFLDPSQEMLTEEEVNALEGFKEFASRFNEYVQGTLFKRHTKEGAKVARELFYYNDMLQFLLQPVEVDGKTEYQVEENVATAVSYGIFSWIAENATRGVAATQEEINRSLGRPADASVSFELGGLVAEAGMGFNVAANSIGQRIVQALGLKLKDDAPTGDKARLEVALGGLALQVMQKLKEPLIEVTYIPGHEIDMLTRDSEDPTNFGDPSVRFVKLVRGDDRKLTQLAENIHKANVGSRSAVDRLFNVEPARKEPSFEPIPFNQSKVKNTDTGIPGVLAQVLERENQTPYFINAAKFRLLQLFTGEHRALLERMAGVEATDEHTPKQLRASVEAKNDGLRREIDDLLDFGEDVVEPSELGFEQPLYLSHVMWKPQRSGIDGIINPQQSKVHRSVLTRKGWKTEVKTDGSDPATFDSFKLRVLEGLGVKTGNMTNEKALSLWNSVWSPTIDKKAIEKARLLNEAVNALTKHEQGQELAPADLQAVADGVKAAGEKMHSLDALMAMAQYRIALVEGKSFETDLMGEVDGVTNGLMLSGLMLGSMDAETLNRGGFFEQGNTHTQHNHWKAADVSHHDLYETTINAVMNTVAQSIKKNPKRDYAYPSVYYFTGNLETVQGEVPSKARKFIKGSLIPFGFGSSSHRSVSALADSFVESILEKVAEASRNGDDPSELFWHLNTLIGKKGPQVSPNTKLSYLIERGLTSEQAAAIKRTFNWTLGRHVKKALEENFATLIARRDQLNRAANITFSLFDAVRQGIRTQYLKELAQPGPNGEPPKVELDKNGEPIHSLSAAQEKELRNRLKASAPVMQTLMSRESGDMRAGLEIGKTSRRISQKASYKQELQLDSTDPKRATDYVNVAGFEVVGAAPGAAMVVLSTHSTDSAISHGSSNYSEVGGVESLNIHDARVAGVKDMQKVAKSLNEATWYSVLNYSPAAEMYEALVKTVEQLIPVLQKQGTLPPEITNRLVEDLKEDMLKAGMVTEELGTYLLETLKATKMTAYRTDRARLQALSQMASVDQYALEGGSYTVTQENRDEAAKRLAQLDSAVPQRDLDLMQELVDLLPEATKVPETPSSGEVLPGEEFQSGFTRLQGRQLLTIALRQTSMKEHHEKLIAALASMDEDTALPLEKALEQHLDAQAAAEVLQRLAAWRDKVLPTRWNGLGQPRIQSDAGLVNLFARKRMFPATTVLGMLDRYYGKGGFESQLVRRLRELVPADLQFVYVRPGDEESSLLAKPVDGSRAWYASGKDSEGKLTHVVYALSPEHLHSGLTYETLLHEMVHGVLARTIAVELKRRAANPDYKSPALELVDELEALRKKAEKLVSQDQALTLEFGAAVKDIQELVAWGMSNREFQERVLGQIKLQERVASKNNTLLLLDGVKKFFKALTGLLFPKMDVRSKAAAENGLAIFLQDVSGLLGRVEQGLTEQIESDIPEVNLAQALDPGKKVMRYTTLQLFDALQNGLSPEFQNHLAGLLRSIVERLHGPFGYFKANVENGLPITEGAVISQAMQDEAPFISSISPTLGMDAQEAFTIEQIEATLRAALNNGEANVTFARTELVQLYKEAKARLKPSDFSSQALYDEVFKVEKGADGKSDYLSRFAALALGHHEVNGLMSFSTTTGTRNLRDLSLAEKIEEIFQRILSWFSHKATRSVDGEIAVLRMEKLVGQLVEIEAKRRLKLAAPSRLSKFAVIEEAGEKVVAAAREKASKVMSSEFIRKNRFGPVRLVGATANIVVQDQVDRVVGLAMSMRDQLLKDRQGIVAGLVEAVRGPNEAIQLLIRAAKKNEKDRQHVIEDTAKGVLSGFRNGGADLTTEEKSAVTQMFLRTGMHVLLRAQEDAPGFDMREIQRLIEDRDFREKEIKRRIALLNTHERYVHYFVKQAKGLGYFRATGRQRLAFGMMNAHNVAQMYGTQFEGALSQEEAQQVERLVDELSTLYSIGYVQRHEAQMAKVTGRKDRAELAKEVLRQELGRDDGGNGIEQVLLLARWFEAESAKRLFGGRRTLMMKGYTPEIYNPHTSIVTARSAEDVITLKERGYKLVSKLPKDPTDPNPEAATLWVLKDGGPMAYTTGAVSLTDRAMKGNLQFDSSTLLEADGLQKLRKLNDAKVTATRDMFRPDPGWHPENEESLFMTPVLDSDGGVTGYRYLMQEETKDDVLERDSSVDRVMGMLAGSIVDKEVSQVQNREVIQALKDLKATSKTLKPHSFVRVGADSVDPAMREIWRLLPDGTRRDVREIWGEAGMWVPYELLDPVFGYRKLTLSGAFERKARQRDAVRRGITPDERLELNALEEAYVALTEQALYAWARGVRGMDDDAARVWSRQAGVWLRRGERGWQEIVREVKDTIVIRGLSTMIGNIKSNISLMLIMGVSPRELLHHHRVAMKGAADYHRDRDELAQLRLKLDSGYTLSNEKEIRDRIVMLEDSISKNPVKELIDAGLMPTIAEDLTAQDDTYTYKALFSRKVDEYAAKVHPMAREAGKWAYMTRDTPAYRWLSQITQQSDFVARYTLYQHLISRKENPLNRDAAIQRASEAFVNYDIPMHRSLQYLDDMGLMMFTKYFLYIQRVLLKMGKEHPVRTLLAVMLGQYMDGLDLVTDSWFVHRVPSNPIEGGAFQVTEIPEQLPVIQGIGLLTR